MPNLFAQSRKERQQCGKLDKFVRKQLRLNLPLYETCFPLRLCGFVRDAFVFDLNSYLIIIKVE